MSISDESCFSRRWWIDHSDDPCGVLWVCHLAPKTPVSRRHSRKPPRFNAMKFACVDPGLVPVCVQCLQPKLCVLFVPRLQSTTTSKYCSFCLPVAMVLSPTYFRFLLAACSILQDRLLPIHPREKHHTLLAPRCTGIRPVHRILQGLGYKTIARTHCRSRKLLSRQRSGNPS